MMDIWCWCIMVCCDVGSFVCSCLLFSGKACYIYVVMIVCLLLSGKACYISGENVFHNWRRTRGHPKGNRALQTTLSLSCSLLIIIYYHLLPSIIIDYHCWLSSIMICACLLLMGLAHCCLGVWLVCWVRCMKMRSIPCQRRTENSPRYKPEQLRSALSSTS